MIKIYNKTLDKAIAIDDSLDWIVFNPKDYEYKPHVIIEFKEFDFLVHAATCPDCKAFIDSFGRDSVDWYISWDYKVFRLDTKDLGQNGYPKNAIKSTVSNYEQGSKLTLVFHELSTDKQKLQDELMKVVKAEDFEKACVIRDLIKENE